MNPEELDLAIAYLEESAARNDCCLPYDCMCHEQCGEELGYCRTCEWLHALYAKTNHLTPEDWLRAEEVLERRERIGFEHRLEMVKELESIGDYAAADRLFGGDE